MLLTLWVWVHLSLALALAWDGFYCGGLDWIRLRIDFFAVLSLRGSTSPYNCVAILHYLSVDYRLILALRELIVLDPI
jgi:hypothetical protein